VGAPLSIFDKRPVLASVYTEIGIFVQNQGVRKNNQRHMPNIARIIFWAQRKYWAKKLFMDGHYRQRH